MMAILVASFVGTFFYYTDRLSKATEMMSIQQTRNIINSSLAVVFATYAVKGELDLLNDLNGGNPFTYMAEYNLVPESYKGVFKVEELGDLESGWYYDSVNGKVIYKTYYDEGLYFFSVVLDYRDVDGSGRYEPGADEYQRLYFQQIPQG
jgi:hypothetical protein